MSAQIIQFPARPKPTPVPPFDPTNPAHVRAWRALIEFGRKSIEGKW